MRSSALDRQSKEQNVNQKAIVWLTSLGTNAYDFNRIYQKLPKKSVFQKMQSKVIEPFLKTMSIVR